MLIITQVFQTEDGITFDTKNKALIYAAIQASGVYLENYIKKALVDDFDKLLMVTEKGEGAQALEAIASSLNEEEITAKNEKSDMEGLKNYIQNKLKYADTIIFPDTGVRTGFKAALQVVLDSMKENGY
jgi:hypothetical protein